MHYILGRFVLSSWADVNVTAAVSLPMQVAKILKTKTAHTANGSSCSRRRSEPSSCAEVRATAEQGRGLLTHADCTEGAEGARLLTLPTKVLAAEFSASFLRPSAEQSCLSLSDWHEVSSPRRTLCQPSRRAVIAPGYGVLCFIHSFIRIN